MLQLALAALLAGAPLSAAPVDTPNGDDKAPRTEASVGIFKAEAASDEAIVNDTYSFGRAEPTFLKLWVGYAWGRADSRYDASGNEVDLGAPVGAGTLTSQRAFVGAQVDFINFPAFRVGAGGQLMLASSNYDGVVLGAGPAGPIVRTDDTGFGLQNAKLFLHARGHAVGVHGGYILDLGDQGDAFPTSAERSDLRDALFVGANFDYPARNLRLFGGVDYFLIQDNADLDVTGVTNRGTRGADLLVFNMGGGVRFGFVELGAAALIRADVGVIGAGHQGSIAPYLRLSPPQLPLSLAIRGAVTDEYADYGFSLGGANKPVTQQGFTVAATFGF